MLLQAFCYSITVENKGCSKKHQDLDGKVYVMGLDFYQAIETIVVDRRTDAPETDEQTL